ncbi:MAG: Rv1733c family protein [Streptosporangiaceae bacterium]
MRSHEDREPGSRPARLARWLGFDRNPLRRGTDRIEAALRLVMMIMLVAAVPAAAVVVGQRADHLALNRARAQQVADHLVNAVLLEQAPATGIPDPYTSVQTVWVPARWQPPGLPPRTGEVLATAGARKGSTVRIWIDASGAVTAPPSDHRDIAGDVSVAVMATCLVSWLVLLASGALVRRALDRRRLRAWEAEWRAAEPLWSGRR